MARLIFASGKENRKTLEEMWKYIEDILSPYDLVPKKYNMTNDQILKVYLELFEADEMFRQLAQIVILKEEIDKLNADSVRLGLS